MPKLKKPLVGTCDLCGNRERKVRYLEFHQVVGAILMRFQTPATGNICRECATRCFRRFSLITFFFGWWSISGILLTPVYLLSNTINFVQSRKL